MPGFQTIQAISRAGLKRRGKAAYSYSGGPVSDVNGTLGTLLKETEKH